MKFTYPNIHPILSSRRSLIKPEEPNNFLVKTDYNFSWSHCWVTTGAVCNLTNDLNLFDSNGDLYSVTWPLDCEASFFSRYSAKKYNVNCKTGWSQSHWNRQGSVQMRTIEPTIESADCWSATHSHNFIFRVK